MFLRSATTVTLDDVIEEMSKSGRVEHEILTSQLKVDLTSDEPVIRAGENEFPVTSAGLDAVAAFVDIPTKWIQRQGDDPDFQQHVLNHVLDRKAEDDDICVVVSHSHGVAEVRPPGLKVIHPLSVVETAGRVIGTTDAKVTDWWNIPNGEMRLDVMVPEGYDRGWHGDLAEGDITGAGLRFEMNTKYLGQFHAPQVSPFFYRLACTNGYERADSAFKVDARSMTLEGVMAHLEYQAEQAFATAERMIDDFYAMRSKALPGDPEQLLLRLGREHKLHDKVVTDLIDRLPVLEDDDGPMNQFDFINFVTNAANNPHIKQAGVRRKLQIIGTDMVESQDQRCSHCQSKLGRI